LDEQAFPSRLAAHLGWGWQATLTPDTESAAELRRVCPARIALRHRLVPLKMESAAGEAKADEANPDRAPKSIVMACYDPFDLQARQSVARSTSTPVQWLLAPRREVLRAIQDFYGVGADTFEDILKTREADLDDSHLRDGPGRQPSARRGECDRCGQCGRVDREVCEPDHPRSAGAAGHGYSSGAGA
jgi:hypothetical protein